MLFKVLCIVILVNFCASEIELPKGFRNFKDALESDVNKAAVERLRKEMKIDDESLPRGTRIAGGSLATLGQIPYQAVIFMDMTPAGGFICGGSLVTYRAVLTAAHCIVDFARFEVYLGIVYIGEGGIAQYGEESLTRANTQAHAQYNPTFFTNDIGFIYLPSATSDLTLNAYISLIPLPIFNDTSLNIAGKLATVSGFGRIADLGSPSLYLRYVDMPIMSNAQCEAIFGTQYVKSTNLCTDGSGGRSSCAGDSGGPVTTEIEPGRRVIVGIVSFGVVDRCAQGFPAGNTRVTGFYDWIAEYVNRDPTVTSTTVSTTTSAFTTPGTTTTTKGAAPKMMSGFNGILISIGLILLSIFKF